MTGALFTRFAIVLSAAALVAPAAVRMPTTTRVYELRPDEGVFAYARISPDGRVLAYASQTQMSGKPTPQRTIRVIELATSRVLFTEPGIDAYWSVDGRRMIFLSLKDSQGVSIWHQETGRIVREVAPASLGDYFSWSVRDGRNLILTIRSNYYYLQDDHAVLPHDQVPSCPGIGAGERPLISKDGRRITTFVRGVVVVRNLNDCENIITTGLRGAKADFSWDGRYVAFHAAKTDLTGYEIVVVDLERRTMRTVTDLPGSSYFPSWTRDGRLCFRYDGAGYRGFMIADNVLNAPERPLPPGTGELPVVRGWSDIFSETAWPRRDINLVLIWAPSNAHSPDALIDLQQARDRFRLDGNDVGVWTAVDPASRRSDVESVRRQHGIGVDELPLAPAQFVLTEAVNQLPTTLMFRDGRLVDRRLGAQSADALRGWVSDALARSPAPHRR